MANNIQLVTKQYLDTILRRLKDWMPFKRENGGILQDSKDANGNSTLKTTNVGEIALGKYNETDINTLLSIGIGSANIRKNALKIDNDGNIYIIPDTTKNSVESLQSILDKKGVSIYETYANVISFATKDNIGRLFYISKTSEYENVEYSSGLYIVSYDTNGSIVLINIGSSLETDLSNYYTKEEINVIIDNVVAGDIDLSNYYTINEVDEKLDELHTKITSNAEKIETVEGRIDDLEDWADAPITTSDLEVIIGKDINNDGKIG